MTVQPINSCSFPCKIKRSSNLVMIQQRLNVLISYQSTAFKNIFQRKICEKEHRTEARSIYVILIPVNQSIMDDVYT